MAKETRGSEGIWVLLVVSKLGMERRDSPREETMTNFWSG
jgi:hypothetical protein